MKKKNDNSAMIDKLYDHCEEFTYTIIICDECDKNIEVRVDAIYASKKFYNNGWRVIDDKCYCPNCANTKQF